MAAANVPDTVGDHVTVPVYWSLAVIDVTGVAPLTGTVTPCMAVIVTRAAAVVNARESLTVVPMFSVIVAALPLMVAVVSPVNV